MATIYKADGTRTDVSPQNKRYFSLKELQKIVGGYIANVYLNDNKVIVLNDEGKLEGLSLNVRATEIFRKNFPCSDDCIVGDVLITESKYLQ
jgi:hypothetical protein